MIRKSTTSVFSVGPVASEQARGSADLTAQSDQYSFGLVLYELAAGRRAFQRNSAAEIMTAIIREEADPLPATVPPPLRWIVERLLAKDPSDRYGPLAIYIANCGRSATGFRRTR